MSDNIKQNIVQLLTNYNLTQANFGKSLGVSQKKVSTWVTGTSTPSIKELAAICNEYNITLETLVRGYVGQGGENAKDYTSGKLMEENGSDHYNASNTTVHLDENIFNRNSELNMLVRFLSRNHERLKEDELYRLYLGRVVLEAKNAEEREALKNEALKKGHKS